MSASTIDVNDVIAQHGEYYQNNGQNLSNLKEHFYVASATAATMLRIPTVNTKEPGVLVTQQSVLQGFQPTWTPYGNVSFSPVDIDLFPQKIDLSYSAADLYTVEKSWIGFLATLDKADRSQWPFVRYMIEKHILAKRNEDYELNAIYKGAYVAPTAGTPSPASQSMNGLKYITNKAISDGYAATVVLGVPPTDPVAFVDYVEAFVAAIPEEVRQLVKLIRMSVTLRDRYRAGMRKKYNMNYAQTNSLLSHIDFDDMQIGGFASAAGSNKLITTIDNNLVEYTKRPDSENVIEIEKEKRNVHLYADWWKGIGYNDPRYAWSNDVELTPPDPEEGG